MDAYLENDVEKDQPKEVFEEFKPKGVM